jgi:hypothetical protein
MAGPAGGGIAAGGAATSGLAPVAAAISLSKSLPLIEPAKVSSDWPDTASFSRSKRMTWIRVLVFFPFFLPLPATFST